MATAPHSSGTAQGLLLARLFVCLLLAAGILMLLAPLCTGGMTLVMTTASAEARKYAAATAHDAEPMIAGHGGSCDVPMTTFPALHCGPSAGPATLVTAGVPTESDAVLMACIVVLVAILVAALGLRPPWPFHAAPPPSRTESGAFARSPRRPTLAELGVLRT